MGPYQRTPFSKLLELLDTQVFSGSVCSWVRPLEISWRKHPTVKVVCWWSSWESKVPPQSYAPKKYQGFIKGLLIGLSPFPVIVANEGLGWDSLLNMKQSWWSLLLGRGTTQTINHWFPLIRPAISWGGTLDSHEVKVCHINPGGFQQKQLGSTTVDLDHPLERRITMDFL